MLEVGWLVPAEGLARLSNRAPRRMTGRTLLIKNTAVM